MNVPMASVRFATVTIRRTKEMKTTNGAIPITKPALMSQTRLSMPNVAPGSVLASTYMSIVPITVSAGIAMYSSARERLISSHWKYRVLKCSRVGPKNVNISIRSSSASVASSDSDSACWDRSCRALLIFQE